MTRRSAPPLLLLLALPACAVTSAATTPTTPATSATSATSSAGCVAGPGHDYVVGEGPGELPSPNDVPWESLGPGDSVRIRYRAQPYRSKVHVSGAGTAERPILVCGIPGPRGERPVLDGRDATTRKSIRFANAAQEQRAVLFIDRRGGDPYTAFPTHIIIQGLELTGQYPDYSYTDTAGAVRRYGAFGACLWVERGQHITVRDNVLHDCTNGLFTKSTDDGEFTLTRDLLIQRNHLYGNGVTDNYSMHDSYVQSLGVTYEFNDYGPLRPGATGTALKDRSVGAVIRYNRIVGGARSLDLVEAEDYPTAALADPRYRRTAVYGNLISADGTSGVPIHYGGDHYGAKPSDRWGEPIFRRGTLYFFHNTMVMTGTGYGIGLFQIGTAEDTVEAWNNVFVFTGKTELRYLRVGTDGIKAPWVPGGTLHLGVNWVTAGTVDSVNDPYRPVSGPATGLDRLLSGPVSPLDPTSFRPLAGSAIVDAARPGPAAAAEWPVEMEFTDDRRGAPRKKTGTALDLGALDSR